MNKKILLMMAVAVIGGCSSNDGENNSIANVEKMNNTAYHIQAIPDVNTKEIQDILHVMQDAFEGSANVAYDPKGKEFVFSFVGDMHNAISLMSNMKAEGTEPEQPILRAWEGQTQAFAGVSQSITNVLGPGYKLTMLDAGDNEEYVLIAESGVILYDAFGDGDTY